MAGYRHYTLKFSILSFWWGSREKDTLITAVAVRPLVPANAEKRYRMRRKRGECAWEHSIALTVGKLSRTTNNSVRARLYSHIICWNKALVLTRSPLIIFWISTINTTPKLMRLLKIWLWSISLHPGSLPTEEKFAWETPSDESYFPLREIIGICTIA